MNGTQLATGKRPAAGGGASLLAALAMSAVGGLCEARPPQEADRERAKPAAGARLDGLGDPLPAGAIARLGTLRFQHGEPVLHLSYSPGGQLLVSSGERFVRVWDVTTGKEVRRFDGSCGRAAFTPDGKSLVTGGEKVCVREIASGRVTDRLPFAGYGVALSPDGKTLAVLEQDRLRVWDTATRSDRLLVPCPKVRAIALSPDGSRVAVAAEGQLYILVVANGDKVVLTTQQNAYTQSFSPDGKTLAARDGWERIGLWDVATGRERPELTTKGDEPASLVGFSPDGKLLALAGRDAPISLWDVAQRRKVRSWQVPPVDIASLAFAPDGKAVVVGNYYGRLRVYDVATGRLRMPFEPPPEAGGAVAFRADGKSLLTTSRFRGFDRGGEARVWDADTGKVLHHLTYPQCTGYVDPAPDGSIAVVHAKADTVHLLKVPSGDKVAVVPADYRSSTFSLSDGMKHVATADAVDGSIGVRDVTTGKEVLRIRGGIPVPGRLGLSPDGNLVASASPEPRLTVLHRVRTGFKAADGTFRVWDVASGKERWRRADVHSSQFAFSPDGKWIATSGQMESDDFSGSTEVRLWDAATGREIWLGQKHSDAPHVFAFTPDSRMLATADLGGVVCFWEVATGQVRRSFRAHDWAICSVSFSPEGGRLATLGYEETALVWDLAHPPSRLSAAEVEAEWEALASPDGERAYAALRRLSADPERSLPLLRQHLRPTAPDREVLAKLIAELDDDQFPARERAEKTLGDFGDVAVPSLRQALQAKPSPEAARRLRRRLDATEGWDGEQLRAWRALEVVERIGTAEARTVLHVMAQGPAGLRLTRIAKESLARSTRLAARP
jgi:WD40 repeat protein